jgi:hypothetical protein
MILTGETKYWEKHLSQYRSATYLTWTDLGENSGLRGENPATNRLSYGTATFALKYPNKMFKCYLGN